MRDEDFKTFITNAGEAIAQREPSPITVSKYRGVLPDALLNIGKKKVGAGTPMACSGPLTLMTTNTSSTSGWRAPSSTVLTTTMSSPEVALEACTRGASDITACSPFPVPQAPSSR